MKIIRVLYYKDEIECGCEFFNKNSDIKEIETIAEENNKRYKSYTKIETIEVKHILMFNSNSHAWMYFYKDNEYDKAENTYIDMKNVIDKQDVLELITL